MLVQNDLYRALSADTKTLIVGKTDDENFVYNISKGRYEIRAEFSNEKIKSFSNFEKMMSYLLKEQIELLQNYVAFNEEAEELPQDD